MPALPWKSFEEPNPSASYVAMCSRLPLRRYRSIVGFLRDTLAIRKQLKSTPGVVGYTLDAKILHKTFWTLSAWTDDASLRAFTTAAPHRDIIVRLRPKMEQTKFVFFAVTGNELPLNWAAARARMEASTKPGGGATDDHR